MSRRSMCPSLWRMVTPPTRIYVYFTTTNTYFPLLKSFCYNVRKWLKIVQVAYKIDSGIDKILRYLTMMF